MIGAIGLLLIFVTTTLDAHDGTMLNGVGLCERPAEVLARFDIPIRGWDRSGYHESDFSKLDSQLIRNDGVMIWFDSRVRSVSSVDWPAIVDAFGIRFGMTEHDIVGKRGRPAATERGVHQLDETDLTYDELVDGLAVSYYYSLIKDRLVGMVISTHHCWSDW